MYEPMPAGPPTPCQWSSSPSWEAKCAVWIPVSSESPLVYDFSTPEFVYPQTVAVSAAYGSHHLWSVVGPDPLTTKSGPAKFCPPPPPLFPDAGMPVIYVCSLAPASKICAGAGEFFVGNIDNGVCCAVVPAELDPDSGLPCADIARL
jgi:hypothetical protein